MKTNITRFLSFTAAACAVVLFSHLSAAAASITLPATNQTVCYDTAGVVINCTATRQDGALRMGASWPDPRFSDNGNGTFTDSFTGLVWMSDNTCLKTTSTAGGTIANFLQALNAVANLADGLCGLTDGSVKGAWRIPNINEANSMYDVKNNTLAADAPFKNRVSTTYAHIYTSTTYKKDPNQIIYVSASGGANLSCSKTIACVYAIIAVRNP